MDMPAGDSGPRSPGEVVAALSDQFGPALFRTARTLLGRTDLAEDAVQETFVGLVRARVMPSDLENARAYLFTALRHAAAKLRGRANRERLVVAADLLEIAGPIKPTEFDRAERLESALQSLPADQREVIALKIDGGLTFAEVAVSLGISPNTAASRYRYAFQKLRTALVEAGNDS